MTNKCSWPVLTVNFSGLSKFHGFAEICGFNQIWIRISRCKTFFFNFIFPQLAKLLKIAQLKKKILIPIWLRHCPPFFFIVPIDTHDFSLRHQRAHCMGRCTPSRASTTTWRRSRLRRLRAAPWSLAGTRSSVRGCTWSRPSWRGWRTTPTSSTPRPSRPSSTSSSARWVATASNEGS